MGVSGLGSGLSIGKEVRTITAASYASNVVTYTTSAAHGLGVGSLVRITGITPTAFNVIGYAITGTTGSTVKVAFASTPGTYSSGGTLYSAGMQTAPTRVLQLISESIGKDVAKIDAKTLKGARVLPLQIATRQGRIKVMGDTQSLSYASGDALMWEARLGTNTTTGAGPYTHTASLAAYLPSYTMEVSIGATSATMIKTMTGMMVDSWEMKCQAGEFVTLGDTWVGKNLTIALGATLDGTDPTGQVAYNFVDGTVTLAGTAPGCVKQITFSGNNNLDSDGLCMGSQSITTPERNDTAEITGSMEIETNITDTNVFDRYVAGTLTTVLFTLSNAATPTLSQTVTAKVQFTSDPTPKVTGPGKLTYTAPFKVYMADGDTDAGSFSVVTINGDSTA